MSEVEGYAIGEETVLTTETRAAATRREELAPLREKIDRINRELLELLRERAQVVLVIAERKRLQGAQAHDPWREEEMLAALAREPLDPLLPSEMREIFSAIFRASLAMQNRLRSDYERGSAEK